MILSQVLGGERLFHLSFYYLKLFYTVNAERSYKL